MSPKLFDNISPTKFIIPYYHMVSDDKVPHVRNLYPYKGTREFKEDLEYLLKYYNPIGLTDLLGAIKKRTDFSRRSFHLTFDDGFRELHDVVAPILIQKGIPATFFVNSAFTDNRIFCYQHKASLLAEHVKSGLSDSISKSLKTIMKKRGIEVKDIYSSILSIPYGIKEVFDELSNCMDVDLNLYLNKQKPYLESSQILSLINSGFTIGSHSIDHPFYETLDFDEQVHQTLESTKWVREKYGLNYGAFAFPYTDSRVEEKFFSEIRASGLVDISFGTSGMVNREISWRLRRFSLEKPLLPADRLIAMQNTRMLREI